jgi:hypothetical protein
MDMSIIHDPALYQLRHALRGHVHAPGEPEYERLARVKAGRDPDDVFRATGNPRATD